MPETFTYPFVRASLAYKTVTYAFTNKGVVARYASDRLPAGTYLELLNFESRQENALSSRFGQTTQITPNGGLGAFVHTLAHLKSIGQTYRYASTLDINRAVYRRAGGSPGAYTSMNAPPTTLYGNPLLSGKRWGSAVYRPNLSGVPYLFIADQSMMVKDNGRDDAVAHTLQNWGGIAPDMPALATVQGSNVTVVDATDSDTYSYGAGVSSHISVSLVNTTIAAGVGATGVQTVNPVAMTNIFVGSILKIDAAGTPELVYVTSVTSTGFTATFAHVHGAGCTATDNSISVGCDGAQSSYSVSSPAFGPLNLNTPGATSNAAPTDTFTLLIQVNDAARITGISLTISGGSFGVDTFTVTIPIGDDALAGLLSNTWFLLKIPRSRFVSRGAGDWTTIKNFTVFVNATTGAVLSFSLNNLALNVFGPDATGGVGYDYRVTGYNARTGYETNPSPTTVTQVFPFGTAVAVTLPDPWAAVGEITHKRIYRRGGTLSNGWYLIGQVDAGNTSFTDTISDALAVEGNLLEIDNDPPVTSALQTPCIGTLGTSVTAGSTQNAAPALTQGVLPSVPFGSVWGYAVIGSGPTQETVLIQSGSVLIQGYFQYAHGSGESFSLNAVLAQPCNLTAGAYERMWVAGDPNNPHILYYSKPQSPEQFPPQNTIEIGDPGDPIMALVTLRGVLFVFTLTRIWTVTQVGNLPPVASPTAVKHGLIGNWAWTISEGAIWYLSWDGPRMFNGAQSAYMGQETEWVWTGKSLAPGTLGPTVPADVAQLSTVQMAFFQNEIYILYAGASASGNYRLIYHTLYNRWRQDRSLATRPTTMLVEEDSNTFLVADASGNILQDRLEGADSNGSGATIAIPYAMQTPYFDQEQPKNEKNYVELWLDIDTAGQTLNVTLKFNNGSGAPADYTATVNTNSRQRVSFNLNSGDGILAYNVSLLLSATLAIPGNPIVLYNASYRFITTAERRLTWDTYFQDDGTPAPKVMKQGWFMYEAYDPSGITVGVYTEASTTPAFTFVLPQSMTRTEVRVRFPATKYKLRRFVGVSAGDFKMWGETYVEWKPVISTKGYARAPLKEPT